MKLDRPESKTQLLHRLRRIEGQVRGVQNMLDQERDCVEIMQQLAAVRAALQGVSQQFLEEYINHCLMDGEMNTPERRAQLADDLLALIHKAG